ncbi:MAG: hypothetical protein WAN87_04750 [Thermoplasmata archaeon]
MAPSLPEGSSARSGAATDPTSDKLFGFAYVPNQQSAPRRRSPVRSIWFWPVVFGTVLVVAVASLYAGGLISALHLKNSSCYGLNCGVPFGLGQATPVNGTNGTAGECAAMHYCYEVGIAFSASGITPSDLQLKLTTSSGTLLPLVSWYLDGANLTVDGFLSSAMNPSGVWTVYPGSGGASDSITDSTVITSAMEIWIDVSVNDSPYGTGATLIVTGEGSFSGSLSLVLP